MILVHQLPDSTPLASSERSMTFIPKKIPDPLANAVNPKASTPVKLKSKSKIIQGKTIEIINPNQQIILINIKK